MARGMAQGNRMAKFRRVTDLFEEGREVVLDPNPEDPILVWVNKLNPFEMDEARKDGAVGRARATMRIEDPDSPEYDVFESSINGRSREDLLNSLVGAKQNEHYVNALDDIRADEKWGEKLSVLERGDAQLDDSGVSLGDDERSRLAKLNEEYLKTVNDLMVQRQTAYRVELETESDEALQKLYREGYKTAAGGSGFLTEYRTTEMFFALRACDATAVDDGWDHSECDHRERLCEHRGEIRDLPEGLIAAVRDAITVLNMSPRDAGNSDAPASSSASSEQPSEQAESTRSTRRGK